ncbi:MAG: diacylglycerol kinase family lipid kinase [Clostridiales bacterium]|nr:diacylglycerol kinase family lipid kinase [Clostridiales bacterium]
MKHVFIINPMAGKGKTAALIGPQIERCAEKYKLDYTIHLTSAPGDALEYSKKLAQTGEDVRIYACGGDGTLYEAVNGTYGYKNVELASIPLGSGNDFVRLFGTREQFCDIDAQVNGTAIELDVIKCGNEIAINQCSMGLDAEVCASQASFKKLPLLNGEAAYTAALLSCFIGKMKSHFTIKIDDDEPFSADVLFCVAGNSRWYGGGYMAAPLALPDDGLLDFVVVRKAVSRIKLLGLINEYKAGRHLSWDITTFKRGKKISIKSAVPAAVNVDGETHYTTESTMEIIEKGAKFVIPSTSTYIKDRAEKKL